MVLDGTRLNSRLLTSPPPLLHTAPRLRSHRHQDRHSRDRMQAGQSAERDVQITCARDVVLVTVAMARARNEVM